VKRWLALCVMGVALCAFWSWRITDQPVMDDAAQNLWTMLNLERHGTFSLSEAVPVVPTMQREPLPAVVGALALRIEDALIGQAPAAEYFSGTRARALKYQNVLWLTVLSAGVFASACVMGLPFWGAVACVLLSNLLLLDSEYRFYMLDSILTESAAAAFLIWGSVLLALGRSARRDVLIVAAGLCFGALTLVKAAFLYVTVGLVVVLPTLALLTRQPVRKAAVQAALLALAAAVIVLPWMLRNERLIGYFGVAGRGGEAVWTRAVLDGMTSDEYRGTFYAWAPYPFGGLARRMLGYSKSDLELGGRLQRINDGPSHFALQDVAAEDAGRPHATFTYYRRSRAERVILVRNYAAAGNPQPWMAADRQLMQRGEHAILERPWSHLALSLPMMWRGGYIAFPPLAIAFLLSFRRRREALLWVVLPSLAVVLFYALASPFEPRYAMPAYPLVVVVLALGAAKWRHHREAPRHQREAPRSDNNM
jgi:4-amino-4-deoxy-L-arabinose transferase-like glycosyltransferase